ncbi:MAG: hypothetical protein H8E55_39110 [Pelagibacterales bacterium]|nr:hypothetical protein [Pelagibacterales bacterium]
MDYTLLINELNKASAFDLYRLFVAIDKELRNPIRINLIKQQLVIGMELTYFNFVKNRLLKAKLLELRKTHALVFEYEGNKKLVIPFAVINLDNTNTEIYKSNDSETLSANTLKVGDPVSFHKNGEIIIGIIKRINYKTVSIETRNHGKWRVGYPLLKKVVDHDSNGKSDDLQNINHCLINFKNSL